MRNFVSDLRLGLRLLLRNPGFAATAILLLALGIGANTAIFSVVNAVLLRPLPYQDPSRLMQVWHVPPAKSFPGMTTFSVSPANFLDWQRQNTSFEDMAAYGGTLLNLGGKDRPESLFGATVAPGFFSILRVPPALGRTFSSDEDRPGQGHVAILSDEVWRNHFGSNPAIVGQDITLNDEPYRVVGVMPPDFKFPSWAKLWVPTAWTDEKRAVRGNHNYMVVGRLKDGADIRAAQSELSAISTRLEQLYPEDDKGWGAVIIPLRQQLVGDVRPALLVLLGAVAFVLLIACANVANLVLGKILARKREIAIRSALGASRAVILRQVLAETLLLAVIGGALGLLLAYFGIGLISKFLADRLPRFAQINLDGSVLIFTVVLSLAAGILAGLLPALRFTKTDVNEALKQGQSRGSSDSGGRKTRGVLVTCEVALSLVLLIGAGLMVRTLWELSAIRPGFDPNGVLTLSLSVAANKFPTPAGQIAFFERVLQQIRATPGVEAAGVIDDLPLDNDGSHQPVQVEGQPIVSMSDQPEVDVRSISAGFFGAMHIPLLRGRDLDASDVAGRAPSLIVSQAFAERFWPGQNPLGKHVTLTFYPGVAREVVGVVGDIKLDSLNETRPIAMVYWPIDQITPVPNEAWRSFGMDLAVRTGGDPMNLVSAVTAAVHEVDPETPVGHAMSMNQLISDSLTPQRSNMLLLAAFAGLALLLTAVGIYSVLAYTVRRRVREIGIRMALGASQADVLGLVVRDGMKPILLGVVIGFAAALALGRVVSSLVYGVRPTDPPTFATVAVVLVAVGLLATALPAYRATQVDPTRTLREE
jgi:putative ABC transport system permease protein